MRLFKNAKCVNCGFLGLVPVPVEFVENPLADFSWEIIEEIPPHWREKPQYISAETSPRLLGCYMRQFSKLKCVTMDIHEAVPDETLRSFTTPSRCGFFYKYHPGYSPVEHKELWRDHLNRRTLLFSNIISGIIGATLATIVNIIWNLLK